MYITGETFGGAVLSTFLPIPAHAFLACILNHAPWGWNYKKTAVARPTSAPFASFGRAAFTLLRCGWTCKYELSFTHAAASCQTRFTSG